MSVPLSLLHQDGGPSGWTSGLLSGLSSSPALLPGFHTGLHGHFPSTPSEFHSLCFPPFLFQCWLSLYYSLCLIYSFTLNWQNSILAMYNLMFWDTFPYFLDERAKVVDLRLFPPLFSSDTWFYCDKMFTNSALAKHHKFHCVVFSSLSPLFLPSLPFLSPVQPFTNPLLLPLVLGNRSRAAHC